MAMPLNLVLVRHGKSEPNIIQSLVKSDPNYKPPDGFHDRHDSEMRLSHEGVMQARKTGELLKQLFPEGFDKYYVSSLLRTIETAGNLNSNGEWKIDDRWRERDWGEYGVLNDNDREAQYQLSKRLKHQNKWYWCPPGGESLATGVRSRFEDILDTLHREAEGEDVLVVTHGETIDVARAVLERLTPQEWLVQDQDIEYRVSNCQIIHYTRVDPKTGEVAKRLRWRRSLCAWDEDRSWYGGGWRKLAFKSYSDKELLALAARRERLLDDGI